jgi:RimJ/RimL family protein N-acetyltransferase
LYAGFLKTGGMIGGNILSVIDKVFRKIRYAVMLHKIGGLKELIIQVGRQIYSKDILFGLEKLLNTGDECFSSKLSYSLQPATKKDIEEILVKAKTESKDSVHELVERAWFYESGFNDSYIARITSTQDICFIAWIVSSKDNILIKQEFRSRMPFMENNTILLENCYTFEKFRGNNLMPSVVLQLCQIAKSRGFNRMITYVRQGNKASIKGFEKLKLNKFEEINELKFLFFTRRNHKIPKKEIQ